jgi:hypothetical protein
MNNSCFDIPLVFISKLKHFVNLKWMSYMQYMIYRTKGSGK